MSESAEIWTVVCSDRGQHQPRAMFHRLYARMSDGQVTRVVGAPRLIADNLGGRSRAARRDERNYHERQLVDLPTVGADRLTYQCATCGRNPQLRQVTIVRAMNRLLAEGHSRRVLDVSYLG